MKTFMNKIKKSNKVFLCLFLISWFIYLVCYILFTKSLIQLSGVETLLRVILILLFGLWIFAWGLVGLISLFTRKYKSYIIMFIFNLIFIFIFGFTSYYIDTIYKEISEFSKNTVTYTSVLVNMKNSEFSSDSKIGMINNDTDTEGSVLAKEIIKEHKLNNEIVKYDDYYQMLIDLYNGNIDALFLSGNYTVIFGNEEEYENIGTDTKVVYSFSKQMENKDNISFTDKKLTEPFTILVMGVDSEIDGLNANSAFNGDTLMMVTFNPKTLTATMFSMPRDTYVPIACRNGAYSKINSAAAYGTNCVISTVQSLTEIDIDYYIKVNFKAVVDLVDALNGVEVDVEKPYFRYNVGIDWKGQVCEQNSRREFGNSMVCMDPGYQTLNGEQALAYARNRHQYLGSDLDRIRHQQEVVQSIFAKIKTISTFEQFTSLLDVVQKNIDTNLTTEQILSLYNVGKSLVINNMNGNAQEFQIYKTYLETYSLPVWTGSTTTSALGYYKSSLDDIVKAMRINLELERAIMEKSFEIDYNEDYETKAYGQGLRSNPQETIMPSFIGKTASEASAWASQNGLIPTIETVSSDSEHYNSSIAQGLIGDQSIVINTLIVNQSEVTFYVNNQSNINDTKTNDVEEPKKEDINKEDNKKEDDGELPPVIVPIEEVEENKEEE